MKRAFFLFFLFCCGAVFAAPNFPSYKGFFNDFSGSIDAGSAQKIELLARSLEKKTSAELVVAVVKTVAPLDSKTYAVELFQKWGIGKKGKDNGLLILLVLDERRIEVEVGYGLEGVINDARAGAILDQYALPYFKQGEFGQGLYNAATAFAQLIALEAKVELESAPLFPVERNGGEDDWKIAVVFFLIFIGMLGSGIIFGLIGGLVGAVVGFFLGGPLGALFGGVIGFVVSFLRLQGLAQMIFWSIFNSGRGGGGFGGGGFGGFGGGRSGGGGAGRGW